MTELPRYTVRPFSKPSRKDQKDTFHLYLSPNALRLHKLQAGDPCLIWKNESQKGKAIAWTATEKLDQNVVQMSRLLQSAYEFSLGDKVFLSKAESPIVAIRTVYLEEIPLPGKDEIESHDLPANHWEGMLGDLVYRAEYVGPGMIFEDVIQRSCRRSFRVTSIDDQNGGHQGPARFNTSSEVKVVTADEVADGVFKPLELSTADIAGLAPQIKEINKVLRFFDNPFGWPRRFKLGGLLLYGPAGTGKSMLLKNIAATGWGPVFVIDTSNMNKSHSQATTDIRNIFKEAKSYPRSILLINDLDLIVSEKRRRDGEPSYTNTLRNELSALNEMETDAQPLVAAATSHVDEIDDSLLGHDSFQFQIEIPTPNAKARIEIIKALEGVPPSKLDILLEKLGERTHGYSRYNLTGLMRMADLESEDRQNELASETRPRNHIDGDTDGNELAKGITESEGHGLTQEDIDKALKVVRPTAMRELLLDMPEIRWSEIGGQEHVKQSLKERILWPLTMGPEMERLKLPQKKGLLLYGPPGCSKTMIARAFATESGFNFLGVKGSEFFNMYVGESERRLREIFSKAKALSPSIIFFDEVDTIAKRREGVNLNVLATLLTEMDGIEPLRGVSVIAATNTPWLLDDALLRPGRIDDILYVGLPDLKTRSEILNIRLAGAELADDVSIHDLAQKMGGYSGAEIISICNKASGSAFREYAETGRWTQISKHHFNSALSAVGRRTTQANLDQFEEWRAEATMGLGI